MAEAQKPLELILARNLLVEHLDARVPRRRRGRSLVFFNDAAGALLGRRFEEAGAMAPRGMGRGVRAVRRRGHPDSAATSCPITQSLRTAARRTRA